MKYKYTSRDQLEQALRSAETRQRTVLENVVDGIITIDAQGVIQDFNRAAERMFGYAAAEVVGRNVKILMPDNYAREHDAYLHKYLDTKVAHIIGVGREVEGQRKDGSQFPLDLAVSEMVIDEVHFFSGIVRDITERKAAEREIIAARDAAEHSARAKAEFLANMSHEIRTPMNAVINLAYLAQKDQLADKTRNYLSKIETAGKNLLGIINDILDVSKIEAGKLTIENQVFDMHEMLDQLAVVVGNRAMSRHVEVMFSVAVDVPHHVMGDSLRLGQVLTNFLSNAIKFTEHGDVLLVVSVVSATNSNYRLQFEIRDTGIGMSQEQVGNLFQPFRQADGSTSREFGGTGLGLAISKRLVELMGGQVSVESRLGIGSTFRFTVNMELGAPLVQNMSARVPDFGQVKILVVDDNEAARLVMQDALNQFGFVVIAAASGKEALEKLSENNARGGAPFELVLLDWIMPGLDGLQTLQQMRALENLIKVPKVVLVTAYGMENIVPQGTALGADGYLAKPFNPSTLYNAILQALGFGGATRQPVESDLPGYLRHGLQKVAGARVLLIDDNDINQMIGVDLLENQGLVASVAGSAREAFAALDRDQFDLVLMDVQMPEIDGLEATRRIRSDDRFQNLPILAMTAHAMVSDRDRSLAAGMNDHLTKPINPEELYRALVRWIPARPGA